MANAGTVNVDFETNVRNFNRAIDSASRRVEQFGRQSSRGSSQVSTSTIAMGNAWVKMGEMALGAIKRVIEKVTELSIVSSKMAIAFENDMAQVSNIFGDSADSMDKFINNSTRGFGMARSEAAKYSKVLGRMVVNIDGQNKGTEVTQKLLRQSAIIASKEGRSMEDTMGRIASGLRGETEAIEDLGIYVSASMLENTKAFETFGKGARKWSNITDERLKNQIRLYAILEQSVNEFGTELDKTVSVGIQQFNAIMSDASLKLGQAFLPLIERAIPLFIGFALYLEKAASTLEHFSNILFGTNKTSKNASKAQKELKTDIEDAGKAAKGALGSFDEINTLQGKMADTSIKTTTTATTVNNQKGDSSGGFVGPVMPSDLEKSFIKLRKSIEPLNREIERFTNLTKPIWEPMLKAVTKMPVKQLEINVDLTTLAIEGFTTVLGLASDTIETFVKNYEELKTAYDNFSWSDLVDDVTTYIEETTGLDFSTISTSISEMWEGAKKDTDAWWVSIKKRVNTSREDIQKLKWVDIKTGISKMWEGVRKDTNDWWYSIKERVKLSAEDITGLKWDNIKEAVSNMWEGVKNTTEGIWIGIKNTVIDSVNFMIDKINYLITKFNALKFETPFGPISAPQVDTIDLLEKEAVPYGGGGGSFAPNGGTSFAEPISEQARATNVNVKVQIGPEELRDIIVTTLEEAREISGSTLFDTNFAGGGN